MSLLQNTADKPNVQPIHKFHQALPNSLYLPVYHALYILQQHQSKNNPVTKSGKICTFWNAKYTCDTYDANITLPISKHEQV
jgi:hypothetical protein